MSAQEERDALALPPALYGHALRLLRESPDGVPVRRGYRLPDTSTPDAAPPSREALGRLSDDAARSLGRRLTRTGTTVPAVATGIALLARLGEAEDIPCLSALGLFREFTSAVVDALDAIDRQAAAVVWLAVCSRSELRPLVGALWAGDRQAVRAELEAFPALPRCLGSTGARRIAEATRLTELLDRHPSDTALLARAGRILARMVCAQDRATDVLEYRDALALYERVVTRAGLLPPALDHHATLLSLAWDLNCGPGVLLDWPPGRRAMLLESLGRLLAEPRWAPPADTGVGEPDQRLRAGWVRRTGRRPFALPGSAPGGLRVEVVAGDPVDRAPVETRVLVDGRPVVPAVFARGPAHSPEYLLDDGRLRAGPEPREVQLAEACCTEGCCGALYVTIRRDGDQVVWENWRRPALPGTGKPAPEPPVCRFDAAAYDAEIARAESDVSWSWPARTVARLVKAGLVARPELLRRWDLRRGWISSGHDDPDSVVVTFWYEPGPAAGKPDGIPLQFLWVVPDDGAPPAEQAAAALRRLAGEDPKTYGRVCGGSRERAEELGFPWQGGV
ncbi:hypothetical protein [Streptomyces sp. NPDC007100]|uniref:hypothetical protein n=1 Tax=Streptomyces sp. NPDC007100 TaxID=3155602 RepID=UPI00340482B1